MQIHISNQRHGGIVNTYKKSLVVDKNSDYDMAGRFVYRTGYVILAVYVFMSMPAEGRNVDSDFSVDSSHLSEFHDDGPAFLTMSQRIMSSPMIKFVIMRGCDYTAAFVKSHLLRPHSGGSNATHDKCNIKKLAERRCEQSQIPPELCCAVISCGVAHMALAFNIDDHILHECNLTRDLHDLHMTPMSSAVGKRHDVTTSRERSHPSDMCDAFPTTTVLVGKRDSDTHSGSGMSVLNTLVTFVRHLASTNNHSSVPTLMPANGEAENTSTHRPPSEMAVQRWCKRFSRTVNRNYGFSSEPYVRQSVYWVQDLYSACRRKNVPKPYAHSLVGCGIDLALSAMDVPKWLAALYKTVL